jgi:hypothetical protein
VLIKTSQDTEEPRQSHRSIVIYISRLLWGRTWRLIIPIYKSEFVFDLPEKCPCSARAMHLEDYWGRHIAKKNKICNQYPFELNVLRASTGTDKIGCWSWHRNNPFKDIKLCLWNGILHEQQVLLLEFLSSSQLASAYEGIWKSLKLCFNVAVAHHVSIICVTRARYWEFAWELHSELCWILPSNDSTDSLHSWILPYKNCNADEIID